MWKKFCVAFVVAAIGGTMLSITEVDAQSTVDDSASCESSSLEEAVDLIKEGMNDVGLIREDLKAVNLIREDLEDVKNVLESNQQQNNATCISKKDLAELRAACTSNQQQSNESGISKKDLEELKVACASNQQQRPQTDSSNQAVSSSLLCEYRTRDTRFLRGIIVQHNTS